MVMVGGVGPHAGFARLAVRRNSAQRPPRRMIRYSRANMLCVMSSPTNYRSGDSLRCPHTYAATHLYAGLPRTRCVHDTHTFLFRLRACARSCPRARGLPREKLLNATSAVCVSNLHARFCSFGFVPPITDTARALRPTPTIGDRF